MPRRIHRLAVQSRLQFRDLLVQAAEALPANSRSWSWYCPGLFGLGLGWRRAWCSQAYSACLKTSKSQDPCGRLPCLHSSRLFSGGGCRRCCRCRVLRRSPSLCWPSLIAGRAARRVRRLCRSVLRARYTRGRLALIKASPATNTSVSRLMEPPLELTIAFTGATSCDEREAGASIGLLCAHCDSIELWVVGRVTGLRRWTCRLRAHFEPAPALVSESHRDGSR